MTIATETTQLQAMRVASPFVQFIQAVLTKYRFNFILVLRSYTVFKLIFQKYILQYVYIFRKGRVNDIFFQKLNMQKNSNYFVNETM